MTLSPSNFRLVKIAAIGGLFVSVSGYYMKIKVDERLRSSDYYLKAVAHVKAHRPLVDYLGEPLKFGKADLSDISRNYTVDESEAVFEIPITGSKQSGKMHFKAVRTPDDSPTTPTLNSTANSSEEPPRLSWKVVRLEVSVNSRPGERVLVPIKPLTSALEANSKKSSVTHVKTELENKSTEKSIPEATKLKAVES